MDVLTGHQTPRSLELPAWMSVENADSRGQNETMRDSCKTSPGLMLSLEEVVPSMGLAGCYHFKQPVSFDYRVTAHHLILIEQGEIKARTPSARFTAKAGDLVCFRPTEVTHYSVTPDTLCYQASVEFAPPPRHQMTPFLGGIGPLPLCQPLGSWFHEARACFEKLCLEITRAGDAHRLRERAAICDLLALVALAAGSNEKNATGETDRWLRTRQRIEASLTRPLSIKSLASELGVTTTYFIREFKKRFGITPKACNIQSRLRESVRQLRGGEQSIKSIALSLGFEDPKAFTRRFKHHYGLKPSDLTQSQPLPEPRITSKKTKGLFPLNQHLLPPSEHPIDFKTYLPKGTLTPAERRRALDKLKNPANYA